MNRLFNNIARKMLFSIDERIVKSSVNCDLRDTFAALPGAALRVCVQKTKADRCRLLASSAMIGIVAVASPAMAQTSVALSLAPDSVADNKLQSAALNDVKVVAENGSGRTDVTPVSHAEQDITVTARRRIERGMTVPIGAAEYGLNKEDWNDVLVGTSPLALLKNLPGVTFTSTDAYGLDLSDGFLLVRGFRQQELGIVFEGIPLGDGSYGSVTGTAPLSIGVAANINSVVVSPGAARLSTFSNTQSGGEVVYSVVEPTASASFGGVVGYGSNNTYIAGATVNTGQIGDNGPRMLFGVERISKNKYTGRGTQYGLRANAKIVQDVPWGKFKAYLSYARYAIWGYNNTSFDMLNKLGYEGTDILYPDYERAVFINKPENANVSCGAYTCGKLAALLPYDTGQGTDDLVGNLTHSFNLTPKLSGSVMAYGAISRSDIEISDVNTPSLTGAPFSSLVWRTRPKRFGGTASLNWKAGAHTFSTGLWIERIKSTSRFESFSQPLPGQGPPLRTFPPYDLYGPAFQVQNDSRWRTNSLQVYVQDVFKPTDTLTITGGVKGVNFVTRGGGIGPDQAPNGMLRARDFFLPQFSVDWHPSPKTTLYLDTAKTTIGYRVSSRGNIGPISSAYAADSQAIFDAALPTLRPEKDWNFTVGAAHEIGPFSINLDGYYGIINNRLINGSSGPQFSPVRSVGTVSRSQLIGGDIQVTARVFSWLTASQSFSVANFRYRDDLIVPGAIIPLKGRFQPGYPRQTFNTQLSVKYQRFDGGLTSSVYIKEPFTYSNDIYVPTYWQLNAHASYRLPKSDHLPDLVLRLDVNNLLDRKQIGSVGIGGYSVSGDYQTFMRSAPQQLLLTLSTKL